MECARGPGGATRKDHLTEIRREEAIRGGRVRSATVTQPPEAVRDWWDDPALPWRHKPSRADLVCLSALGVVAVYALVMLPLRPVILGLAPHVLGSLGYRTGLIMTGALASVGDGGWPAR